MAKQTKRTKKFVKNNLDRTIKERKNRQKKTSQIARAGHGRKAKDLKKDISARKSGDTGAGPRRRAENAEANEEDEDDDNDETGVINDADSDNEGNAVRGGPMDVDDFLEGGFAKGMSRAGDGEDEDEDEEGDEEGDDSLQDVEDLSDDEEGHAQDLAKLAEKDPEFFKYLQENDRELLDFGADEEASEDEDSAVASGSKGKQRAIDEGQVVTREMLRAWQKSILQTHSLKAFRRLLLAFRAAAHMGADDDVNLTYRVNDAGVFNKIIMTALKYVPVVLQHHIPAKQQASGKYKLPTNSKKYSGLQRSILSFYSSLHRLLRTLPEPKLLYVCVDESTKSVPWLLPNRRMAREYVKILLDLWATSNESVRVAAFLGIRRMAAAGDDALVELCLRGVYRGLVRGCRTTTIHTIDTINLMKNSASELYLLNLDASYQQAFSFIRQLAVHLRACLKNKTPESFQAVYNWQYVHCIDFWATVLATTCDKERAEASGAGAGASSTMQPLIYPLVQAATGAVRLLPTSRYFPMRFHIVQSLLRLIQRTGTYVPLAPMLLEVFDAPEFTRKPKPSTFKPLNMDVLIRAPKTYVRTKVYADQLLDETSYLLLEFLACMARSIAFPELVVPIVVGLRRTIKMAKSASTRDAARTAQSLRSLVDKIARHSDFVAAQRRSSTVDYAPRDEDQVHRFMADVRSETPIESAARLARKVRADKQALLAQTHIKVGSEDDDEEGDDEDEMQLEMEDEENDDDDEEELEMEDDE